MDFEPLYRFRGFYVRAGAPEARVKWLQWAFQKAFCDAGYQAFNEKKFMNLIESYRDTAGSKELIDGTVKQYRAVYKTMGLEVK